MTTQQNKQHQNNKLQHKTACPAQNMQKQHKTAQHVSTDQTLKENTTKHEHINKTHEI